MLCVRNYVYYMYTLPWISPKGRSGEYDPRIQVFCSVSVKVIRLSIQRVDTLYWVMSTAYKQHSKSRYTVYSVQWCWWRINWVQRIQTAYTQKIPCTEYSAVGDNSNEYSIQTAYNEYTVNWVQHCRWRLICFACGSGLADPVLLLLIATQSKVYIVQRAMYTLCNVRGILIFKNFWISNSACSQFVPTASLV